MSLQSSAILSAVRSRTARGQSITSIDTELGIVISELCTLVPGAFQDVGSAVITANSQTVTLSFNYNIITAIVDSSDNIITEVPINVLLAMQAAEPSASSVIKHYCKYDRYSDSQFRIFVHPKPSSNITLSIYHIALWTTASDIDEVPLSFLEALIEGVCFKIELGLGALGEISNETITHKTFYDEQVKILQSRYPLIR